MTCGSSAGLARALGTATLAAAVLTAALGLASPAARVQAADDGGWRFTVGGGAFVVPDYPGSNDYEVRPAPVLRVQKDNLYIETHSSGIRANVLPHGRFELGPVLRYGGGRDNVEDAAVDRLPDVDDELSIGVFAAVKFPDLLDERDSLGLGIEAAEAADNGATLKLGVDYDRKIAKRLSLGVGLSTTYVDDDYAQTYFSVSDAGAAASGLSRYDAGGGFRDVTLSLTGRFAVTASIGVGAVAGISKLLGDVADSPVVEDRGTDAPVFGGAFVTYSF